MTTVKRRVSPETRRKLMVAREAAEGFSNKFFGKIYIRALEDLLIENNSALWDFIQHLERFPVSIEEFLDSKEYMGATDLQLWPRVREAIVELNQHWWDENKAYKEAILAGATRTGKSTILQVTGLYRLHILACMRSPQAYYGLPTATIISFSIFGAKPVVTKKVVYKPWRKWLEIMPFFQKYMPVDAIMESEAIFRNKNIYVTPIGADAEAALGAAVMMACFPASQKFLRSDGELVSMQEYIGKPVRVKTRDEDGNVVESQKTTVVPTGVKSLVRLYFDNEDSIVCTPEQKFKGINGEWVIAEHGEGRAFRFSAMQDMRSAGYVSDTALAFSTRDRRKAVQNFVSRSKAYRKKADRNKYIAQARQRRGKSRVRSLRANLSTNNWKARSVSWTYTSGVQGIVSALRIEDKYSKRSTKQKGKSTYSSAAKGSVFYRIVTCWYGEDKDTFGGRFTYKTARPCVATSGSKERKREVLLRVKNWGHGKVSFKNGDTSSVLAGPSDGSLGVGASSCTEKEGRGIYTRFLHSGPRLLHRSKGKVFFRSKCRSLRQTERNFRQADIVYNGRRDRNIRVEGVDTSFATGTPEVRDNIFYRGKTVGEGARCIKVERISGEPVQVFDIENTGPTHIFFAATRSGFLEAKNCIDEINFMQVIAKSKRAEVAAGRAGAFDQAKVLYETVSRRIKGTFIKRGPQIPICVESSSTRYKGDFTDTRIEQVKLHNEKGVFIYAPKQFEARPIKYYCGEKFRLLVGNEVFNDTRVLRDDEQVPEGAQVEEVPIEYKEEFLRDPHNAMRDVLGISNSAVSPFIRQRIKFYDCLLRGQENGLESFLVKDHVILGVDGLPVVKPGHYCRNPSRPRYVHIDLSLNGDRAGIAMVRYDGMTTVERAGGLKERLPLASVELACSIEPDSTNEIDFAEIRVWVKTLKDVYGYPIKAVSYDGAFSIESIQQWRKQGMKAGHQSVDRSSTPYRQVRDAVYDGRLLFHENELLFEEFFNLEYDEKKDKVDHPATSGKDVADAVTGAYTTLIERRSSWVEALRDDEAVYSERPVGGERYDSERRA